MVFPLWATRSWVAEPIVGLKLLDLADSSGIREIAHLDTPGDPSDVAMSGDYVLLADGRKGLRVIDTTTLAPVRGIEDKNAVRISVVGTTAFLVGFHPDANYDLWPYAMRLWAVDVADPSQPVERGEYVEPYGQADPPPDTGVVGETLYVTAAKAGLDIVRLVEGDVLQIRTPGPTLTPLPTPDWRTPTATDEPVIPLPSPTPNPTSTAEAPPPTVSPTSHVYLPAVRRSGSPEEALDHLWRPLGQLGGAANAAAMVGQSEGATLPRRREAPSGAGSGAA
jgi:hypothetical protein